MSPIDPWVKDKAYGFKSNNKDKNTSYKVKMLKRNLINGFWRVMKVRLVLFKQ